MKTLQKTAVLLLLSVATLPLPAQTPAESQLIAAKTHSIGLNLYPIIKPTTALPVEVIYKYQPEGKNRAWRLGLFGQYNGFNQEGNSRQLFEDEDLFMSADFEAAQKELNIGAYAGHEWQWALGKRWQPAIGADVRYSYTQRQWSSTSGGYVDDAASASERNSYAHGVSLQPFIGLSFAITSHWLLYVDCKVDFTCSYATTDGENALQVPTSKQSTSSTHLYFNYLPFQQISLMYAF